MYANHPPDPQQTLDIFKDSWASRLPEEYAALRAGSADLFNDPRVNWAISALKDLGVCVSGSHILELGPLEGGHTYQLSKAGATLVTAIEAHKEAYLKCLVVKELLSVQRVNFLFGDAVSFLREIGHLYDVGFASGFLYHLSNPVETIELLCRRCGAVFLWTVYYDPDFSRANRDVPAGNGVVSTHSHSGFEHRLHRHDYGNGLNLSRFWGGMASHSHWMEKDQILAAFAYFGLTKQTVEFERNQNGSALRMVAARG